MELENHSDLSATLLRGDLPERDKMRFSCTASG